METMTPCSIRPAGRPATGQNEKTEAFRSWLRDRIDRDPRSLHAVEVEAGIRGNALGKFLRGERGSRHSLTPLNIRRLAPALMVGEPEMLARAGHLTSDPGSLSVDEAIAADTALARNDKALLLSLYRRLAA